MMKWAGFGSGTFSKCTVDGPGWHATPALSDQENTEAPERSGSGENAGPSIRFRS
jgi:hypothetical protein